MKKEVELAEFLQLEYSTLKAEQTSRIAVRDNTVILTVSVFSLLLGGYFSTDSALKLGLVLAVPFISTISLWVYLSNDIYISMIRKYIVTELRPVINLESSNITPFSWEDKHRQTFTHIRGKIVRLSLASTLFVGWPTISLILGHFELATVNSKASWTFWTLGSILTALSTIAIIQTQDL